MLAATLAGFEDRAQPLERALVAARGRRAQAQELLHELVGLQHGRRLRLERDLRLARPGVLERPRRTGVDAVEAPAAAGRHDPRGRRELGERDVAVGEAIEARLHAKARAGAAAVGVLAREMPVDHAVVAELGVVGDVGEVLEDLLARLGDRRRQGDRLHRSRNLFGFAVRSREPRSHPAHADRVAVLAVTHALALDGLAAAQRAAQLADRRARRRSGTASRRRAACGRSRRSRGGRRRAFRRSCAAGRARGPARRS